MNTNIGAPKMLMTVLICGSLRMYLSPSFASCLHLLSMTQEELDGTQLTYTHLRTLSSLLRSRQTYHRETIDANFSFLKYLFDLLLIT